MRPIILEVKGMFYLKKLFKNVNICWWIIKKFKDKTYKSLMEKGCVHLVNII